MWNRRQFRAARNGTNGALVVGDSLGRTQGEGRPCRRSSEPTPLFGRWLCGVSLALVVAGAVSAQTVDGSAVVRVLEGQLRRQEIVGVAAVVEQRGELLFQRALGVRDRELGSKMTLDTIFAVQELVAPVLAVATLGLQERGKLSLDDPVADYLPFVADLEVRVGDGTTRRARRQMTIRDLLRRTDGLVTPPPANGKRWQSRARLLAALAGEPLAFDPGDRWSYGPSVELLGRILEVVTEQSLERCLHRRIFRPLGMTDTAYHVPSDKRRRLAITYKQSFAGRLKRSRTRPPWETPASPLAERGMYSTPADCLRFLALLRGRGEVDGVRLLRDETFAEMTTDQLDGVPRPRLLGRSGFGLGVAVVGAGEVSGNGMGQGSLYWGGSAGTAFWVDPTRQVSGLYFSQGVPQIDVVREFQAEVYRSLLR